jgi:hypothetical protein
MSPAAPDRTGYTNAGGGAFLVGIAAARAGHRGARSWPRLPKSRLRPAMGAR